MGISKNIIFENYFKNEKSKNFDKSHTKNFINIIERSKRKIKLKGNIFSIFSKNLKLNFKIKDLKKYEKFKRIIIIGMGGSILGSAAINNFLKKSSTKEVLFVDNLDPNLIDKIYKTKNLKNSLFIIISKSGNTFEVLTIVKALKSKAKFNKNNSLIITEKKGSELNYFAKKEEIKVIEHRNYVGGRYSIFSETALLPACLFGINIKKFRSNILRYLEGSQSTLLKNLINLSKVYKSKKINSLILLSYCPGLDYFLLWCQQLIAESLGKKGKGILPVISIAPRDNHSLLQLFLDGPKDKFYYVFSIKEKDKKNNLNKILNIQKNAMVTILKRKKLPFISINMKKRDEETLGELFSYFIFETIFIGDILQINPFNQPAVEQLKMLTKKNLSKSTK